MKHRRALPLKIKQLIEGKGGLITAAVLIVGVSLYQVFFTSLFSVREISVFTEHKDINADKMEELLSNEVLQKNILFLSLRNLSELAKKKAPELQKLRCDRKIFSRILSCEAFGYELVAVMKHEGKKYYINENGLVTTFDSRKLGLPTFDLILNPKFAGVETPREEAKKSDEPVRAVFEVSPGKKILSGEEIKTMLSAITEFEKVLERKVFQILYVQVAGELSLTTKGDSEHLLTVLMDIRRNLPEQFKKLEKSKKVIDLRSVERIDLSIDGEKVFYR